MSTKLGTIYRFVSSDIMLSYKSMAGIIKIDIILELIDFKNIKGTEINLV